jgi:hypothetical protein
VESCSLLHGIWIALVAAGLGVTVHEPYRRDCRDGG